VQSESRVAADALQKHGPQLALRPRRLPAHVRRLQEKRGENMQPTQWHERTEASHARISGEKPGR